MVIEKGHKDALAEESNATHLYVMICNMEWLVDQVCILMLDGKILSH
jgi:hypothetical protein